MFSITKFRSDQGGNIGTIFAIMILPVLMILGVAVDYSRIAGAREEMQKVVDNAAATLGSMLKTHQIDAEKRIADMINANSGRSSARVNISLNQNKLRIEATDQIDTPLLSTIGRETSGITASIEIDAPTSNGTGRTASVNKAQLKRAEKQLDKLMRQLQEHGNPNDMSLQQRKRMVRQVERQIEQMKRNLR